MKKAAVLVCMASVLLSGCSGAGGEKVSQTADSCAQAVASELAKTDWTAVSTEDVYKRQEQRGSLYTITARGSREELLARVNALNPTFCEMLPLTLEEIFINETEVAGYDVKKLLF